MSKKVIFQPTEKQQEFISAVMSGKYKYLMYGGAIRGGKTYVGLSLLFLFCKMWPGSRWALVRKDLPTLRRNTLPSFLKLAPDSFVGPVNKSTWSATCKNGSEILFFTESIKDDPELNRWKGLEVNGFFLEEANEITYEAFLKAIERAGTWVLKKDQPPPLIVLTCNPAKNWVKSTFYDPWQSGTMEEPFFYLPAKIADNPHLPAEYVKSLKSLPEAQYRTFVLGDWSAADDPEQLIKWSWVNDAIGRELPLGEQHLGVDVARFGDDETVIAHRQGNTVIDLKAFHGIDIVKTATIAEQIVRLNGIKAPNVRIDTVGLGAGVADIMRNNKLRISEFIAGAKPENRHKFLKFKNLRAEAWWNLRELFRLGHIAIDANLPNRTKVIEDLTAPHYSVSGEKVLKIESKDDIKKRLGRSTDYGDAIVQAFSDSKASKWLEHMNTK